MSTKAKRLGINPLEVEGLGGIIRSTAEPMQARGLSEELPATQGKKGQKRLRLNISFTEANKAYLTKITRLEGLGVAEYINGLINEDRKAKEHRLDQIEAMLKQE